VEGRNIRIDTRWAALDGESRQQFAKELVGLLPDLILTQSTPITAAVLAQTRTIPIIFAIVVDPIGSGFVASFPQPGGNVTGFIGLEPTMSGKWLELLKEIAPRVNRVAFLFNPVTASYAIQWELVLLRMTSLLGVNFTPRSGQPLASSFCADR